MQNLRPKFKKKIKMDQDEYICLGHTSSENVFKTSSRSLDQGKYVFLSQTSSRRLQDVFKTSCQDVFKASCKNVLKTFSIQKQSPEVFC